MKVLPPSLLAQTLVLVLGLTSVHGQDNFNQVNAQTIDDLYYLLGPNFKFFVATYWRYLISSCDILKAKLERDIRSGFLRRHCPFLIHCPQPYSSQSCLVYHSTYYVALACCSDPPIVRTPQDPKSNEPDPTLPPVSPPTTFNISAQHDCAYGKILPTGRIFGGTPSKEGEFPWMAMLLRDGKFLCACTILDTTHVLTTAHCFDFHRDSNIYEVIAGKYRLDASLAYENEQRVRVVSFVRHELYDQFQLWNDIALLELVSPLTWTSYVQPACLPSLEDSLEDYCTVAGWGNTEDNELSPILIKVTMQAYTRSECLETFKDTAEGNIEIFLQAGSICAANGLLGGKDACKGDSGGPLMCIKPTASSSAYFVFGIVSNGNDCAKPGEPGVYTYIPYYLPWIQDTIDSMS